MSGNYPPGTSASDPRAPWNAPDHSHEHEWWSNRDDPNPTLEDSAAIFTDYCEYSEGRYRDEWSCEETRYLRCELDRVVLNRENAPDITYLNRDSDSWNFIESVLEEAVLLVEEDAWNTDGINLNFHHIDPANKHGNGYVEVSIENYTVVYSQ